MCSFSETMPDVPEYYIPRDQYLDHFDSQFESDKVLCVKGKSGVGVTTVMALFAQRHADECASFFNTSWSPAMLNFGALKTSIVKQLKYYIGDDSEVDILHSLIHKVNNTARKNKGNVYFVFDGIDLLPSAYKDSIKQMLSQLYGINNAKFLFSGNIQQIKELVPDSEAVIQTNDILPFSQAEVQTYFKAIDSTLVQNQVDLLSDMSKRVGNRVHIISQKLQYEGVEVLEDMYLNNVDDLYQADFEYISGNDKYALFMSLLTYSEYPLSLALLRGCLEFGEEEFGNILESLKVYVQIQDEIVAFKSDVFRKYLQSKLQRMRQKAELLLISVLEKENVEEAFSYLPALYVQQRKNDTLVKYLTSDKVQHFIIKTQSQAALNIQSDLGYQACTNFESQMPHYFRFAINRSASREMEKNELTDSEVEALMSVGEYEKAFVLAQNVFLHEERLKCFLIIAQYKKDLPEETRQELLTQIESLIKIVQFERIPDKAIELAKLLLPIDFVQALTIIDKIAKVSKNKHKLDRLYAAISVSYNQEVKQTSDVPTKEDLAETRIENDDLRQMAVVMKSIMRESTVEQVLEQMDKLPNATSRLYFLHFWIPDHKKAEHIEKAISYALQLAISESNTTIPKVSIIRRICEPLPLVSLERIIELISMVDAVITSIKYPTIEYVELQLTVIKALKKVDLDKAGERALNLYVEIQSLSDKAIQAHGKALLLRDFDIIGSHEMETWIMPSFDLRKELIDDMYELLSKSAYHVKMVEGPIKALVCEFPTLVHEIIEKMNTRERRCRAYLLALIEYVSNIEMSKFSWSIFDTLFNKITYDPSDLERPLWILASRIIEEEDMNVGTLNIKALCSKLKVIERPSVSCKILANFYVWMSAHNAADTYRSNVIEKRLHEIWEQIGSPDLKTELGFRIAQILSKDPSKELARKYVAETTEKRDSMLFSSLSCAETYSVSLNLLEHSLGLLIRSNLSEEDDLKELEKLFSYEGDEGERMIAMSRIALEYLESGQKDKFSRIVHCDLSSSYKDSSIYNCKRVIYHISPALYLCGRTLFYDRIDQYDDCFKNSCIENVARYIETHYPYTEYMDSSSVVSQRVLEYGDYECLLDLMEHTTDECFIFNYIDTITKSLKENRDSKLSLEQISLFGKKLSKLVQDRYPMTNGIQHEGYKIICNAMIDGNLPNRSINTTTIRTNIDLVPNVADRSFLYSNIAGYLKKRDQSESFIKSALQVSDDIVDMFDRINRLNNCFLQACRTNKSLTRPIATKTMGALVADQNGTYQDMQRCIDTISEYDDKLAEDVLEMIDTDPARVLYKRRLKARLASSKKIKNAKNDFEQIGKLSEDEQIRFYDKQMEALVKGTSLSKDLAKTKSIVHSIYNYPITEMQSAVLYFLENLYNEYKKGRISSGVLRDVHHVLFQNIQMVLAIAAGTQTKLERINQILAESVSLENIIGVGEGEKGYNRVLSWYKEHPHNILQIVDAYFKPNELQLIKSMMDINNELQVSILTHLENDCILADYQAEWDKISTELPGSIKIATVSFADQPDKSPIHDRWWMLYNVEEDEYVGLRSASLSTMGSRETEISNMDSDSIRDINELWNRYAKNRPLRVKGRGILYDDIEIVSR